ncbi:hypothetical protein G6011_02591 [Alternaria panax]|uniref:Uncharacterized protein n=1 Tax=Alternaria panax TaxID=48097 RepID=A0AAD4FAU0_9PLEO|nr:hypothetical protein G6011_02591 [Alternaria panax]
MPKYEYTTSAPKEGFFLLPAELRSMIYGHVLTTPNATLEYTTDNASGHKQINQLQHVNTQLNTECADLELQFNLTIIISSRVEDDTTAVEQFFELLGYLPPERQEWLRTIILHSAAPDVDLASPFYDRFQLVDSRVNMFRLAKMCTLMPHMTVKYKLSTFSVRMLGLGPPDKPPWPVDVVMIGSAFSEFLRGDPLPELRAARGTMGLQARYAVGMLRMWRDIYPKYTDPKYHHDNLQAENLRFYPTEDVLESENHPRGPHRHFHDLEETKDLAPIWKAVVRRWVAEGL